MMQVVGNVTGFLLVSLSVASASSSCRSWRSRWSSWSTMLSVVLRVGKGMPPKPRQGRSWGHRPRGVGHRHPQGAFLRLAAGLAAAVPDRRILLVNFVVIYLRGLRDVEGAANSMYVAILVVVVVANVVAIMPGARLSDRIGRKPLIFAACARGRGRSGDHRAGAVDPDRVVGATCSGRRTGCSWRSTGR